MLCYLYFLAFLVVFQANVLTALKCNLQDPPARLYHFKGCKRTEITNNGTCLHMNHTIPHYFIIHGWLENSREEDYIKIATALEKQVKSNVILVDYRKQCEVNYKCIKKFIKEIGKFVAGFLNEAYKHNQINPADVTIIGYSVGSHMAGVIGKNVYKDTNIKLKRITALDPMGLLKNSNIELKTKYSLQKKDAKFVDILYTTAEIGEMTQIGHVDVYANGLYGTAVQLPCSRKPSFKCNHMISRKYYLESIRSCGVEATNAHGTVSIAYGYHMPQNIKGVFIFTPHMHPPFGRGNPKCPS